MLKRFLKWLWGLLEVLIIIYVIFITSCILCRNDFGYTEFFDKYTLVTVNDRNARALPDYKEGDLLVVKNQEFNIDKGDVIYYYVVVNKSYFVRSGVVSSKTEDLANALYILDDGSNTSVPSNKVIGKYVSVFHGLGNVLEILESRFGFLLLVLLPILVVFIYQVYQLVVFAKYEEVDEPRLNTSKFSSNDKDSDVEFL